MKRMKGKGEGDEERNGERDRRDCGVLLNPNGYNGYGSRGHFPLINMQNGEEIRNWRQLEIRIRDREENSRRCNGMDDDEKVETRPRPVYEAPSWRVLLFSYVRSRISI